MSNVYLLVVLDEKLGDHQSDYECTEFLGTPAKVVDQVTLLSFHPILTFILL